MKHTVKLGASLYFDLDAIRKRGIDKDDEKIMRLVDLEVQALRMQLVDEAFKAIKKAL